MKLAINQFLKKEKITDVDIVNSLFIGEFMRCHNVVSHNCSLLDLQENELSEAFHRYLYNHGKKHPYILEFESLIQLFEFVLSPDDKKITGSVYTPGYIRERIVRECLDGYTDTQLTKIRVADIACGCGGFLITVSQYLHRRTGKPYSEIFQDNIYGIDLQEYAIARTKLLLSLLALTEGEDRDVKFNLNIANTLSFDFSSLPKMDVIVGNPPYVCARNMADESRELLKNWSVCGAGNSDLYIPFFQIANEVIEKNGKVGFITMNSFQTSLNGRKLRQYFADNLLDIKIVDFRGYQLFPGKSTYTCLFFMEKKYSTFVGYCKNLSSYLPKKFEYKRYSYEELNNADGWKFNEIRLVDAIESVGIPLKNYCRSRHGIATLKNDVYIFTPLSEDEEYYALRKDDKVYRIEKSICRNIINSNKFNSDVELSDIIEKVIFPYYQEEKGSIKVIPVRDMEEKYPYAYHYLISQKRLLSQRDKGKTDKYPVWYAYGRTQSLKMPRYKLFLPKIANKQLKCVISDDVDLLQYNGLSFVDDNIETIQITKKIIESNLFWDYVVANSKPYSSNYYSISGTNILHFGIPNFTEYEIQELLAMSDQTEINNWLIGFYDVLRTDKHNCYTKSSSTY